MFLARRVHRHRRRRERRGPPGGAHIGGQLDCDGAKLRNDSGPALAADGLQVGQDMYLRGGFTATGGGADVAVDLTGTRVGGTLCVRSGGAWSTRPILTAGSRWMG